MTNKEVMQMALDALEQYQVKRQDFDRFAEEIEALRTALAQGEQEPVAWGFQNTGITGSNRWMYLRETIPAEDQYRGVLWTPLYTAPPQRPWQKLTDEEIKEAMVCNKRIMAAHIEAKLKEKNI